MAKIILNPAASIDGMIADENGAVDWLNDYMRPEEDYGMNAFFKTIGTCIMGSKTNQCFLRKHFINIFLVHEPG